jgi:hypothetical protein
MQKYGFDDTNQVAPLYLFQSPKVCELTSSFPFETVGLIVALFKALLANKTNGNTYLEAQMKIKRVSFSPMTVEKGKTALQDLFAGKSNYPPLLFFDETQVSEESEYMQRYERSDSVRRMDGGGGGGRRLVQDGRHPTSFGEEYNSLHESRDYFHRHRYSCK